MGSGSGGARGGARLLVALVALVPTALALDAMPQEARMGATEARLLVRLSSGGELRVATEPPTKVAIAQPGVEPRAFVMSPARFDVVPRAVEDSWHGLPGTVDVVVRREEAAQATEIFIEADDGGGAVFEWPAQATATRWIPTVSVAGILTLAGAAAATFAWRRRAVG